MRLVRPSVRYAVRCSHPRSRDGHVLMRVPEAEVKRSEVVLADGDVAEERTPTAPSYASVSPTLRRLGERSRPEDDEQCSMLDPILFVGSPNEAPEVTEPASAERIFVFQAGRDGAGAHDAAGPLPPEWERATDEQGDVFYIKYASPPVHCRALCST